MRRPWAGKGCEEPVKLKESRISDTYSRDLVAALHFASVALACTGALAVGSGADEERESEDGSEGEAHLSWKADEEWV